MAFVEAGTSTLNPIEEGKKIFRAEGSSGAASSSPSPSPEASSPSSTSSASRWWLGAS